MAGGLVLSACSSDSDTTATGSTDGDGGVSGESAEDILLDGSSTVAPLGEAAAELFMEENPGVRVTVATSGTSGGFEKFCRGETQMNNASRPIKDSEIEECEANGIGYDGVQVANDALSIVVNNENPIECLTVEQANQIWDEGSTVTTWGDVDGLDLPADLADQPITLYGPGTDSGTFDFFTEVINGEEGKIRIDYTDIGEDDQAAVVGVSGDPAAMGYIPYSFVQEAGDQVKPLEIDGGDGCKEASLDNVQAGEYTPLGRPLFSYASDKALERSEVVDFMNFWIDNSDIIAESATYIPMNDEQKQESLDKIQALAGS